MAPAKAGPQVERRGAANPIADTELPTWAPNERLQLVSHVSLTDRAASDSECGRRITSA
jgi:hypothetical protein